MSISIAVAGGCGDDDDGDQQSGTETPTEPPASEPPTWDNVKVEVEGESTLPDNCVVREVTIQNDGSWVAEGCDSGDEDRITGQLTAQQVDELNTLVEAVLPTGSTTGGGEDGGTDGDTEVEPFCEKFVGVDRIDIDVTVDEEVIEVVNQKNGQTCFTGGVKDARALREYLAEIRRSVIESAGDDGTPAPGNGDDDTGTPAPGNGRATPTS